MKHLILALLTIQLSDLFIYEKKSCILEDHLIADKIDVLTKDLIIRLYSEEEGTRVAEDVLIRDTEEYHVKQNGITTVIQYDGENVVQKSTGECK